MAEQEYFKRALSNFTYDVASGGAIRHLADVGYTVKQIMENLSYPTPYERVQKTVWEHLLDTGVILLEEPGSIKQHEAVTYVKEYNQFGKASFRRVAMKQKKEDKEIFFKETSFLETTKEGLADFLCRKCEENGEKEAYISCKFGIYSRNMEQLEYILKLLETDQRDYIMGLPWERSTGKNKICYHRLDRRMREIVLRLYAGGGFHECCYFLKKSEKVSL
ncbi:MAG: hypothetical protein K2K54_09730 [Lachnospiraceae bacterium]|nr:hypothetical protein [Lachnospiraceae bacterium]